MLSNESTTSVHESCYKQLVLFRLYLQQCYFQTLNKTDDVIFCEKVM